MNWKDEIKQIDTEFNDKRKKVELLIKELLKELTVEPYNLTVSTDIVNELNTEWHICIGSKEFNIKMKEINFNGDDIQNQLINLILYKYRKNSI